MLEVSVAARDGDSGGPILNAQGELAGVLFGAARGRTAGSFLRAVQWFLASVAPRFNSLATPPAETMLAGNVATAVTPPADGLPPPQSDASEWAPDEESASDWGPIAEEDGIPPTCGFAAGVHPRDDARVADRKKTRTEKQRRRGRAGRRSRPGWAQAGGPPSPRDA